MPAQTMTDYALVRSRSVCLPRSRSYERTPSLYMTRSSSVHDLTAHLRTPKYTPQYHSVYTAPTVPYRYYRDYSLYDDYWYDRSYYFSPYYRTSLFPRRYSYSDYISNPYYASPYSSYWTRYKGYGYDYPSSYYSRYYNGAFNNYLNYTYGYTPSRSYVLDSLSTSLSRGLEMYKAGLIPYKTLDTYWLTPSYWDKRFSDWRDCYTSTKDLYLPTTYDRKTRQYFANWST